MIHSKSPLALAEEASGKDTHTDKAESVDIRQDNSSTSHLLGLGFEVELAKLHMEAYASYTAGHTDTAAPVHVPAYHLHSLLLEVACMGE